MSFYVFDLDGTLADCQHRVSMIDGSHEGYRRFFAACVDDKPIKHALRVLDDLLGVGNQIEIWSGRSDEVRAETELWLDNHAGMGIYLTRMRKSGDHRPDHIVKREMLDASIAEGRAPDVVFDDRDRVVAMWREAGIPCFQVAPGAF